MLGVVICIIAVGAGCGVTVTGPPPGAFLGRLGVYDYSPTAIQVRNLQQFWWCGQGHNPNKHSQDTDTIQYATFDVSTHVMTAPITALGETPGAWDSLYVCNPKVIGGTFKDPLGDGKTYTYAMYYVATDSPLGGNAIGVAFSSDGIQWNKYPQPVMVPPTRANYGFAQPAVYNRDQKSGILMFYEDATDPSVGSQHFEATSNDGVHFTTLGKITSKGVETDLPGASWGDVAYDSVAGYWYSIFNIPGRAPSDTGGEQERGQLGLVLYRIKSSSLLTGATPWERLKTFDTNLTGNEVNFIGGFIRDQYGNLNVGQYPTIQILTSISNPKPDWDASPLNSGKSAYPDNWDIGLLDWTPKNPLMALNRYMNKTVHEVTTGWIDPAGGFKLESVLAHIYEGPHAGATVTLYGCKSGSTDYFVSTEIACGGARLLGINGYIYPKPEPGLSLVALYSCSTDHDHFLSSDAKCEGHGSGALLGYGVQ